MVCKELRMFAITLRLALGKLAGGPEEQKTENNLPSAFRGYSEKSYGNNSRRIITAFIFFNLFYISDASGINVTADSGQDVVLPCQTEPLGLSDVYWQRSSLNRVVLHWSNGTLDPVNQDEGYKHRTVVDSVGFAEGNLSLTILDVNLNDTGTYHCIIVKTIHVTPEKYSIRLKVKHPPKELYSTVATPGLDTTTNVTDGAGVRNRFGMIAAFLILFTVFIIILIICSTRRKCFTRGNPAAAV